MQVGLGIFMDAAEGELAPPFSPAAVSPSFWIDPSDLSSMFQDSAGTVPVTADGQPVGLIQDKSGNGHHCTQTVAGERPTYRTDGTLHWLDFDGVDDAMQTNAISLVHTDKVSVFMAIRKASDAAAACCAELSNSSSAYNGTFALFAPVSTADNYFWRARGSSTVDLNVSGFAAPIDNVLTGLVDIAAPSSTLRANGSVTSQSTGSLGAGAFGNHPLYLGSRGAASLPFSGRVYQMAISDSIIAGTDLDQMESYLAAKTGLSL